MCAHTNENERRYLALVRRVLSEGERVHGRSAPVLELFGEHLDLDVSETFPLLTTKAVFWKGVLEELAWFIRGDTYEPNLYATGVGIWRANASKEFQRGQGLGDAYDEGDLGPVYGFQWRHSGARYTTWRDDYEGKGVDQLARLIVDTAAVWKAVRAREEHPKSRRLVMSAWNPSDLDRMVLPPCHLMLQLRVCDDGGVDALVTMRSCDLMLGLPFNIASYALLLHLICHEITGLRPRRLRFSFGSLHIYDAHTVAAEEQLERVPNPAPRLRLLRNPEHSILTHPVRMDDVSLEGYAPHQKIHFPFVA